MRETITVVVYGKSKWHRRLGIITGVVTVKEKEKA